MKCRLGTKKQRIVEEILGTKIKAAFVGGSGHYWAAAVLLEPGETVLVNYKTGEIRPALCSSTWDGKKWHDRYTKMNPEWLKKRVIE